LRDVAVGEKPQVTIAAIDVQRDQLVVAPFADVRIENDVVVLIATTTFGKAFEAFLRALFPALQSFPRRPQKPELPKIPVPLPGGPTKERRELPPAPERIPQPEEREMKRVRGRRLP